MKTATFFAIVGQVALAMAAANDTSTADETTACVTTTILTTMTVTVTKPQDSHIIVVPSTGSATAPPVLSSSAVLEVSTSAPWAPNVTVSEPESPTSITTTQSLSLGPIAPYPTTNSTWHVTASATAPHSSGTGVTGTASATPPQFTAGVGKMAVNGFAMGLVLFGGAFLSL